MIDYIDRVWMMNRSLVTDGYDEALSLLADYVDDELTIHEIPSGADAWTWEVPPKWSVTDAYISDGTARLIEYDHPLRVVTYSDAIDRRVSKEELFEHLHWDEAYDLNGEHVPANPDSLPYVFSFYDRDWGFCVRHDELDLFETADEFEVCIDASFEPGQLGVGEYTAAGVSDETIFLMAHLDHPAQVNDGLSGVAVGAEVIDRLRARETRYTYTLFVVPETIGSLAFLSHNEERIEQLRYGIFLEMLGTDGEYALQRSYSGDTEIDRIAEYVLSQPDSGTGSDVDQDTGSNTESDTESGTASGYRSGPFRTVIGNDEMVTNGPGVRVPTISLSRWPYDEYHTSNDTLDIVSERKLNEAVETTLQIVRMLERNRTPVRQFNGPVFLSGYDLWEKWGGWGDVREQFEYMIMCLEGEHTILDIAEQHDLSFDQTLEFLNDLERNDLVVFEDEIRSRSE